MTVFANMMINSDERFEHLKDSFESFKDTSDDWLINIRGKKRLEVIAWLKERLGEKANFFELLDESRGWTVNALEMVRQAKNPYVMIWIEDHMYVAPPQYLQNVLMEMAQHKADYLQYSWWMNGLYKQYFDDIERTRGNSIDTVTIGNDVWKKWQAEGKNVQLISLLGIFEKNFLIKMLRYDRYMLPMSVRQSVFRVMSILNKAGIRFNQKTAYHRINRLMRFKMRRQPIETPHDFEKEPNRYDILPMRTSVSHRELFACMDDDDDPAHRSSLMTRGMYPVRNILVPWDSREAPQRHVQVKETQQKGSSAKEAYTFFSSKDVRHVLCREYVRVIRGKVRITVKDRSIDLVPGKGAAFFCNIPHLIEALDDSEIERYKPDLGLALHNLLA